MNQFFSKEQIVVIKSKLWWVACNQTPFMIKMAIFQKTLLLQITDLKSVWVTRLTQKEILHQKQIYAKNLSVAGSQQLFQLFEKLLGKPDPQTKYLITKKKNMILEVQISKIIEVYPFFWKFKLFDIHYNQLKLICQDLVNPLIRTIHSQQTAYNMIYKKAKIIQQQLTKKMTQTQKSNYKSALCDYPNPEQKDSQFSMNNYQSILQQVEDDDGGPEPCGDLLIDFNFNQVTQMIYENSCISKPYRKERSLSSRKSKQKRRKAPDKMHKNYQKSLQRIKRTNQQLVNQLSLQKQIDREKKKKKVDFL